MTLLAQVGLVLGATVAIGLFLRGPREHWWSPSNVVVVVIVLLMAATLDGASNQFRSMASQARNDAKVSRANAERSGWLGDPKLGDFVEWLRRELPPRSRFHMVMNSSVPGEMYQWTTYRLLPRLEVAARTTDWLVFVGTDPRKAGFRSIPLTDRRTFAPGLSIARITR
jgi:hypothetical protein